MARPDPREVERLFQAALDLPKDRRPAFLDERCPPGSPLRREVDALLDHFEAADIGFLEPPAHAPALADTWRIPDRIGDFRIVRLLGEGGMGMVFEAEQERPLRRVAVKVMKPLLPPAQLRRFQFEAEVLGQLKHPGIAHVYEAGVALVRYSDGLAVRQPFLAMELIDGRPLTEFATWRKISVRDRLRLVAEVCDAVEYAHRRGVIHRDLKPANILMDGEGRPRILDFGVARVARDARIEHTLETRAGEMVGTLPYMSPEQLRGDPEEIDTRADVYALGVILYELMTGRHPYPFRHGTLSEVTDRLAAESFPPPSRFESACGGDVDTIVAHALSDDRERRYGSAAALGEDLRRHLTDRPILARGDSAWYVARRFVRRHRRPVAIGLVAMLAVLASAVVAWSMFGAARRAERLAELRTEEATAQLYESLVAQARVGRSSRLPGRRTESLEALRQAALLRTDSALRNEVLACLPLSDLVEITGFDSLNWESAVGLRRIDRFHWTLDRSTIHVRRVADPGEDRVLIGPGDPCNGRIFSPDGRYLAVEYVDETDPGAAAQVWVWDIEAETTAVRIRPERIYSYPFSFPADCRTVHLPETATRVGIYDLAAGSRMGEYGIPEGTRRIRFDPRGRRMAVATQSVIEIRDAAQGPSRVRIGSDEGIADIAWHPDGRWIAAATMDGGITLWDPDTGAPVWRKRLQRGPAVTVGFLAGDIVVSSGWDGVTNLWDLRRDQTLFDPQWNRTVVGVGESRLALRHQRGRLSVYEYVPSGEIARIPTDLEFTGPGYLAIDPDGRYFATATRSGIHLFDSASGALLQELYTGSASHVLIGAGGGSIYATSADGVLEWVVGGTRLGDGEGAPFAARAGRAWKDIPGVGLAEARGGTRLVVAGNGRISEIDLETGTARDLPGGSTGCEFPSPSPDGRWLFHGNWRGSGAKILDAATGTVLREFAAASVHGGFDPGTGALVVSEPYVLRVVEPGTWRDLHLLPHPEERFTGAVAFSPRDRGLAALGALHKIWLFRVDSGELLAVIEDPDYAGISDIAFTGDGTTLVALTTDREFLLWRLDAIELRLDEMGLGWD